jgi:hypothetical protein
MGHDVRAGRILLGRIQLHQSDAPKKEFVERGPR